MACSDCSDEGSSQTKRDEDDNKAKEAYLAAICQDINRTKSLMQM